MFRRHAINALILVAVVTVHTGCSKSTSETPGGEVAPNNNAHAQPKNGELSRAVRDGDSPKVLSLLKAGADINETTGTGTTALTPVLIAIGQGDAAMTELLVRNGASLRVSFAGYTARELALISGDEPLTELLDRLGRNER